MVVESNKPMRNTALDVTTMAGAVSAISGAALRDPDANRCLRTYVNLAVNSERLYYPLPERDDENALEFQLARQGYTESLPPAEHKTQPSIDGNVLQAYHGILTTRFLDFQQWLHFQLISPVVITGINRVSNIITQDTEEYWAVHRGAFANHAARLTLPAATLQQKFRGISENFATPNEFALCYGLDVIRRGWQYLERVTGKDGTYFPHPWRQAALQESTSWTTTLAIEGLSYSWGHYIEALIDADERYRTLPKVLELIDRLREAIEAEPSARWIHLKLTSPSGLHQWRAAQKKLFRDELTQAMEQINGIATRAKLPLLQTTSTIHDLIPLLADAGLLALNKIAVETLLLGLRFTGVFAKRALPKNIYAPLENAALHIEESGKRGSDAFFRLICRHGIYEYTGATPSI